MNEDHRPEHPPEPSQSREATTGESSSQPRSGFRQTLQKFKKNATKKISKRFKRSHNQKPAVQNADHEGASLNQDIEDMSRLHPSDGDKPATPENLGGCGTQEASGGPTSKVQAAPSGVEIPDPQSVDAGLRDAREGMESMRLLGKHSTAVASTAKDGPKDLDAADNFQTTYLQPLRVFDTVIGDLANVHPYAKVVLSVLSTASKIILAQTERDESVQSLLKKLEQIYDFMSRKDTLGQISSKRSIAGRIAQQTLECAGFIRDYSEKKSFWKRLGKNAVSETDNLITRYNNALDELMQQFRDQAIRDVADLVRCTSKDLDVLLTLHLLIPLQVTNWATN
ncbi:hypothetical protein BDR03DRAFT_1096314 [Suillus americanus]|nr:hypothetical protein BDR03DRAFT_1096314 [Suillus americanus]